MARRRKSVDEGIKSESAGMTRWMLTYLDMITLLFAVFVLLYSMSQINLKKFDEVAQAIKESLLSGFSFTVGKNSGGRIPLEQVEGSPQRNEFSELTSTLKPEIRSKYVSIKEEQKDIYITIFDQDYFASGSARVTKDMESVLLKIADFMNANPQYDIRIEGHSDVKPILTDDKGRKYDNWRLASDRAINVLAVFEENNIKPERLSASSFGAYSPLNPEDSPEARAMNRRVDLVIFTDKKYKPKIKNFDE